MSWKTLRVHPDDLTLDTTLRCGQSFRWRLSAKDEWSCVLKGRLITLKQTPTSVLYRTYSPSSSPDTPTPDLAAEDHTVRTLLTDYLQLHVNLRDCYARWGGADANFASKAANLRGVRMLRQDPWENLVCFICSSNNNIQRISQMVHKLCTHYGPLICTLDGHAYHDFPSLSTLATALDVEATLRKLGFGYRAKYVAQTAQKIHGYPEGEAWLHDLRKLEYKEAKEALLGLTGVGPKVADCVLLMSLDQPTSIPVDTHVWQIAKRDYGFGRGKAKKGATDPKTLTARMYDEVGDHFRALFGDYSGWASSVLFTADLKSFEDRVVTVKVKVEVAEESSVTEAIDASPLTETVDQKLPFRQAKRRVSAETKVKTEVVVKAAMVTKVKAEEEVVVTKRARRK